MNVRTLTQRTCSVSRFLLTTCLVGLLLAPAAQAQQNINETRYISDILLVPLRTGPSLEYRIVNAGLRSGTEVTLMENDPETQWSRIQVGQQEGWLPTRHLIDEPVALERIDEIEAEMAALQAEYDELQTRYDDLVEDRVSADEAYADIEADRDAALAEVERIREISGNAVMLDERNEELLSRNRVLENENEQLRSVNESLEGDTQQWRMIIGGGLVFFGLLLGLLLPAMLRRRSGDGWA